MIISVDVGKVFDEIQCPNMTYQKKKKTLRKLGIGDSLLNLMIKVFYKSKTKLSETLYLTA